MNLDSSEELIRIISPFICELGGKKETPLSINIGLIVSCFLSYSSTKISSENQKVKRIGRWCSMNALALDLWSCYVCNENTQDEKK